MHKYNDLEPGIATILRKKPVFCKLKQKRNINFPQKPAKTQIRHVFTEIQYTYLLKHEKLPAIVVLNGREYLLYQ
jgi:hypothetical protein